MLTWSSLVAPTVTRALPLSMGQRIPPPGYPAQGDSGQELWDVDVSVEADLAVPLPSHQSDRHPGKDLLLQEEDEPFSLGGIAQDGRGDRGERKSGTMSGDYRPLQRHRQLTPGRHNPSY